MMYAQEQQYENDSIKVNPDFWRGEATKREFRNSPVSSGFDAASLQGMQFAPISYVVPGYVCEGLTIFAGKPKIGKSWACLDMAVAVASGGDAFGSIPCEIGDVLYCSLEDNPRRLQSRMTKILPDNGEQWPARLRFETEWPKLDDGGLGKLQEWVASAANPRLIIIDTLTKVRGERNSKNTDYENDYNALDGLLKLASQHRLAIILVHHVRKMPGDDPIDGVLGSVGLTGSPDTVLVLARAAEGVTLYGRGRDIEEIETAMHFDRDSCTWAIMGEAAEVRRSSQRNNVIKCLRDAEEPLSPRDVADMVAENYDAVRKMLLRLAQDGDEVRRHSRGLYIHADYDPNQPCPNSPNVPKEEVGHG